MQTELDYTSINKNTYAIIRVDGKDKSLTIFQKENNSYKNIRLSLNELLALAEMLKK